MQVAVVFSQHGHGHVDVVPGSAEGGEQHVVAAAQRQRRRIEEDGVELVDALLVFLLGLRVVLDDPDADFLEYRQQREQRHSRQQVEQRVGVGDHAGIDHGIPQVIDQAQPVDDGDPDEHQQGLAQVIEYIDDRDPAGLRFGADINDDGRGDAVAQVNAYDHGVDRFPLQKSGGGKGLKDADAGGGALQYEGHDGADRVSDEGVVSQAEKQRLDHAGFHQGVHGSGHVEQAREQHAEAHGDVAPGF